MGRLLTVVLVVWVLIGGSASVAVAAQGGAATPEAGQTAGPPTAFGDGLDSPATYFAANGSEIAMLTVTDVERGWQDYAEFYEPQPGVEYVAITFEIESVSRGNVPVQSYAFTLIDAFGFGVASTYVEPDPEANVALLLEDTAVTSQETGAFTLVFSIFQDTDLGYLLWQPAGGVFVMVNLEGE